MPRLLTLRATICVLSVIFSFGVAARDPVLPRQAAVASAHPLATAAGHEILAQGGNAFDAAVAVSAVLGVVQPQSSGFGGGGFWLLHRAADGYEIMVDGREAAPSAATHDMYLDANRKPDRNASLVGARAAAIPGMPAALGYLNQNFGRLTLAQCLAPAIRLARDGFPISPDLAQMIGYVADRLRQNPTARETFLVANEPPSPGTVLRQPALAATLAQLAEHGMAAYYRGPLAQAQVAAVREAGGIWTEQDLASYEVKLRAPVIGTYRGVRISTAAPPSSGGIVLMEVMQMLERFDLERMDATARRHLVIEALRRGYRDRAEFLGDPDFTAMPISRLLDPAYTASLAQTIDLRRATPSATLPAAGRGKTEGTDTTHYSVLDREGNRVAGTVSINTPFGSGVVVPATGIVMNNHMDDFATSPLVPNAWGLVGVTANAIAPGKRPLSSMSPTFVETSDRVGILGTPGGSRIISMVLLAVLDFAAGHGPESWVSVPRFHHQYLPDRVQFEPGVFSPADLDALRALGHAVEETRTYGDMHAIEWRKIDGEVTAASDPRGEGQALTR